MLANKANGNKILFEYILNDQIYLQFEMKILNCALIVFTACKIVEGNFGSFDYLADKLLENAHLFSDIISHKLKILQGNIERELI